LSKITRIKSGENEGVVIEDEGKAFVVKTTKEYDVFLSRLAEAVLQKRKIKSRKDMNELITEYELEPRG